MIALLAKTIVSYLLGSIVGSLLVGRLRGVDIRALGSGNAGATNAMRTQGAGFAALVALIDVGKGMFAASVIASIALPGGDALSPAATALACGIAAALGHCFPLWHGFRGGKGAGTLFGAVVIVFPWIALAMLCVWLLVLVSTGYVGLSTVAAALCFPLVVIVGPGGHDGATALLAVGGFALLAWMHRGNIARLARGTEHRFERARLFSRRR